MGVFLTPLPPVIADWFASKGWSPRQHQLDVLESWNAGASALLIAPTGAGKTLAGFLPTLIDLADGQYDGLHTLYISPLKALAVDVQRNLNAPILEMGLKIRAEAQKGPAAGESAADFADDAGTIVPADQPSACGPVFRVAQADRAG